MVKPPSKRHSKSGREPVTIDHESTEAKITASPGDGGPFEGSPAGSASSFSEAEGSALSGQPERGPATQPGQTHGGAAGTSAQADRPVEDDALIDTHFDAQPQQGESTMPAHSSSDMLHADRQDAATADASSANDFGRSGTDESRLPPDPYDTPEPDVSTPVSDNNSTNRRAGAGIGALLAAAVAGGIISLAGYTALETAGVFGAETDQSAADIQSLR
ncbi:MAG TPA: hypothetical protein VGN98_03710, partial [Tianweitania sediminis]|nr:hypothetical protein [Tianweitania sediminis]